MYLVFINDFRINVRAIAETTNVKESNEKKCGNGRNKRKTPVKPGPNILAKRCVVSIKAFVCCNNLGSLQREGKLD